MRALPITTRRPPRSGPLPWARLGALLAGLTIAALAGCETATAPPAGPPNILLITLDTTRADRLGAYAERQLTPTLDGIAARGVVFERVIAQAAFTPTSHASIFTGLNPYDHGLRSMQREGSVLDGRFETMAEVLRAAGYRTGAFVSAFPASGRFGLNQGFDVFDASFLDRELPTLTQDGERSTGLSQRDGAETTDLALAWIGAGDTTRPFFSWIHYFDAHDPWLVPPAEKLSITWDSDKTPTQDDLRALYDAEVRYMDDQIARILEALEANEQLDRTVLVITADHGQGLGDHDWWAHSILYQEQIHLPLILSGPGLPAGRRVDTLIRGIDLLPTVLDVARIPAGKQPRVEGRTALPLIDGQEDTPRPAYAESLATKIYRFPGGIADLKEDQLFALVESDWKYIHHLKNPDRSELYDLTADPHELQNVARSRHEVARRMRRALLPRIRVPKWLGKTSNVPVSKEDEARLRALGYVD